MIRGVDARAPTPAWMRERLERSGQRSISALVDLSNYVMLEVGRPTHVFDLSKIDGGLQVRWGRPGERLELLNGQTVELGPDEHGLPVGVIADASRVESLAGIMGAKKTSELIPLCHPIALTRVAVDFEVLAADNTVVCTATAETVGQTGVEMEALTAVQVALLTIYDMCKAADRGMVMTGITLLEKHGGKSGSWTADK